MSTHSVNLQRCISSDKPMWTCFSTLLLQRLNFAIWNIGIIHLSMPGLRYLGWSIDLTENVLHGLLCLNTWFLVVGPVSEGYTTFRTWSIARVNISLRVKFENLQPPLTSRTFCFLFLFVCFLVCQCNMNDELPVPDTRWHASLSLWTCCLEP